MGSNVDSGQAYYLTMKRNAVTTIYAWWPLDIGPNQWYRLAPSFDPGNDFNAGNAGGCTCQIVNEGILMYGLTQQAYITVTNNTPKNVIQSDGLIAIDINACCAPSNY